MKTIIFSDLHLGIISYPYIWRFLQESIQDCDRIIFNGDIFELLFPYQSRSYDVDLKKMQDDLEQIFETNNEVFRIINQSEASEIIFVTGEHDYLLHENVLKDEIVSIFPSKKVRVTDHWYDAPSASLIVHGNEFDYNTLNYETPQSLVL